MPIDAVTSAEISLPARPDAGRVRERIAALAEQAEVVGLTDNHAGQARMSPLAAAAFAREQGVATVVHVSCRDRNRLALQAHVVGAAALDAVGLLCLYGDPVPDAPRVKDLTATALLGQVRDWAAPQQPAVGAVLNPFAPDPEKELRLLAKKVAAGVDFVQTQMVFDLGRLRSFLDQAAPLLAGVQVFGGVGILRNQRMADYVTRLPGMSLPEESYRRISSGGGAELAAELAAGLATVPGVHALHVYPLGAEDQVGKVVEVYRRARVPPSDG